MLVPMYWILNVCTEVVLLFTIKSLTGEISMRFRCFLPFPVLMRTSCSRLYRHTVDIHECLLAMKANKRIFQNVKLLFIKSWSAYCCAAHIQINCKRVLALAPFEHMLSFVRHDSHSSFCHFVNFFVRHSATLFLKCVSNPAVVKSSEKKIANALTS